MRKTKWLFQAKYGKFGTQAINHCEKCNKIIPKHPKPAQGGPERPSAAHPWPDLSSPGLAITAQSSPGLARSLQSSPLRRNGARVERRRKFMPHSTRKVTYCYCAWPKTAHGIPKVPLPRTIMQIQATPEQSQARRPRKNNPQQATAS